MSKIIFAPDTNFFLNHPDFVTFFSSARSAVHLDIVWPVLCELDRHRKKRYSTRPKEVENGKKAAHAIALIKQLLNSSGGDLDLEIYRPDGIDSSIDPDAQIVDCVVRLATHQHAEETIEFITDDDGLPTVLFIQEKKRRALKNVSIKTAAEVEQQIANYGHPSASIENLGISPRRSTVGGEHGLHLFVDFLVVDMKGRRIQVGIYAKQQPKPFAAHTFSVPAAIHKQSRLSLFVPYAKLGVTPKRHGMEHIKIGVLVWNLETEKPLARVDQYCIDLALGGHFLTKQA